MFAEFMQYLFSGLTAGSTYALVALGFTIIYNASHIINFAQGEFLMIGGLGSVMLMQYGLPMPVAVIGAIALAVAAGILIEKLAIERAGTNDIVPLIIITIGAALFLRGGAQYFWGKSIHALPPFTGNTPINIGGATILPQSLWVLGIGAVVVCLLAWFFKRTLTGKAMLAVSHNPNAARLVGINPRFILMLSFALAAALGAVAGAVAAPITLTAYDVGVMLGLKGFVGAVLGGLGSPLGAVAGGLLLGIMEAFTAGYISSEYKDAVPFVIVLLVLFFMPSGLFGSRATERVMGMRQKLRTPRLGLVGVALVLAGAPLLFSNPYQYDVAIHVLINAMVAVGLNLLMGYAGQISLGHAGFFGLGAYVTAVLSANYGWPVYLSMPAALVVVAILAFLVARPILRLSGHYLAMATLGLGILISIVLRTEAGITGGPDGMMAPPLSVGGTPIYDERYWYALIAVLLLITVWLALNLIDSPVGRALRAVHGSEVAAEVVGVHTLGYKVLIFVVSAVLAALAGVLTAHYSGFVTPDLANFIYSIEFVTMVVLGGMASTYGALIGAVILTLLPQFLTGVDELEMMILGAILMVVVIFMPKGLVPTLGRLMPGGRR